MMGLGAVHLSGNTITGSPVAPLDGSAYGPNPLWAETSDTHW